jgi:hypothetical protein
LRAAFLPGPRRINLAHPVAVNHQHAGRQRLAASTVAVGGIPAGKNRYVGVADQRPSALQVAHDARAAAGREGQVTRGRRAAKRVDLRLVKSASQRQHRPQQNRAITPSTTRNSPLPSTAATASASTLE